jgi:hypothetical protein
MQACKESKRQSAPHAASCSCLTAAQRSAHHARHRTAATNIRAWADAAAVIAIKKIDEDALLARPMHVIADQCISLFFCFFSLARFTYS